MNPIDAIQYVKDRFPFEGYMSFENETYLSIAKSVLRYLQPGAFILDFGAGPCDRTAVIQTLGFKCWAYDDLSDNWHKIGDNKGKIRAFASELGIEFKLADGSGLPYKKDSFDMIMMHDVLEHLHDSPRNLLNDLMELIKPGGYFFFTVPNAVNIRKRIDVLRGETNLPRFDCFYWSSGPWRGHIREYTKGDLVRLAEYLSLEIVELRSCHHMLRRLPRFLHPVYIGITALFPGWRDSWTLIGEKKAGWIPKKSLPNDELTRILNAGTQYQY